MPSHRHFMNDFNIQRLQGIPSVQSATDEENQQHKNQQSFHQDDTENLSDEKVQKVIIKSSVLLTASLLADLLKKKGIECPWEDAKQMAASLQKNLHHLFKL